ncbi:uncharacterized protein [Nicotiana tomentosiformis]|uniref:uncharacterized protein n=1 Tax=Nicotiana tomentosiformis TaxID=4098 RepID=UPI00388C9B23
MKREKLDKYFGRFLEMLKKLYVNITFTEVLTQMPAYAKFLKKILSSKRKLEKTTVVKLKVHCSAILQNKIPQKCGDPGSFTIPCSLGSAKFDKALCDSGASINLMPLSVFRRLEDMEVNKEVPLILGRPFVCTGRAILDIYEGQRMLKVGNEKVVFQMKRMMKYPNDKVFAYSCLKLDIVGELAEKYKLDKLVGDNLERCITQSSTVEDEDPEIKKEDEALETENQMVDEEELKEEDSKRNVELKVLPTHLKYAFLEANNFPVIISNDLTGTQEQKLVELLKKHKKAIGWGIADIQGICPAICVHKILLEENRKPVVQPQCKLNKNLEEVVHKEIINFLYAGVIFPISDSQRISPVQVVPKKGSMAVVKNEDNELIPTRTFTGWRMCIDYRRLNDATSYNQIPIALEDVEKTTFTCPSGMFARGCHLGCEKCHFMVNEGIVMGHKVTAHGIEVDRPKVDVIARLPPPTSVKSIRSFLGHAGFYRRFIKNFSSITKPLTALLAKDVKFVFNVECLRALELIKKKLISALIMVKPDWSQPFEIMCDSSYIAVGVVLGQRKDNMLRPIYYASRTLNDAQVNYATTEKEFFVVVFAFDKFRSYVVGSKVIVHTDHSTLKYLLSKKESKPLLMRWLPVEPIEIREEFPDEQIFSIAAVSERPSCFADVASFLASGWFPRDLTRDQRWKLQVELEDTKVEIALQQKS